MKEVPIFTEEFMALNKARETELKQLRKSVTEMEEQGKADDGTLSLEKVSYLCDTIETG